jgi:serine/threonine protein kinase
VDSDLTDLNSGYPLPGEIIDEKYRVDRLLGAGGMGAVVEAMHLLRRAPVALKFMSARLVHDPAVVERFLNEGVAASRINNEHVVSVLDVSKLPSGQPYLVMEYLEGRDLAKLLLQEGNPGLQDVPRCVHFVLQVLRGLQIAHAAGIIHRDLKPANCLVVERDGEPDFLKIVDFGISKLKTEPLNLTKVGSALGTPLYVSPEQARDPASVDARGDLYSVSVILYELLSGRTPFHPPSGQLSELFMALATQDPQSLDTIRGDLPPGLDAAIQKGLAKSPDDRYRSAADMASALAPFGDMRSERVARQLLQRSTGRPAGGSLPPLEAPGAPSTRTSFGASSVGSPTEKVSTGGTGRSSSPGSARAPSSGPARISSSGVRGSSPGSNLPGSHLPGSNLAGSNLPGPATERVGSPGTERFSSVSGANWLTAGAPIDTAAPTTLPGFLRRRQTELKIGLPVLAALILAAALFKALQGGSSHSAAEPIAEPLPIQRVDTTPDTGKAGAPLVPPSASSSPAIHAIPGAAPAIAPGAQARAPAQAVPTLVPSDTALPPAVPPPAVMPSTDVHLPDVRPAAVSPGVSPAVSPRVDSRANQHGATGKHRRPSLKQIGIEQ